MKLNRAEILYLIQGLFIGGTACGQVWKIFSTQSAGDFWIWWVGAMLICHLMRIPLVRKSKIKVWLFVTVFHIIVAGMMVIGVWLYG